MSEVDDADVSPSTRAERFVADICAEVLQLERVSTGDNFFDLGGHSLLATQFLARLYAVCGVRLPLESFYDAPTVADVARLVESELQLKSVEGSESIKRIPRSGDLELSFSQERVWFMQQLEPESLAYQFQATLRLEGPLDFTSLEKSLAEIVRRHEIYRTTFAESEGRPVQLIHEPRPLKVPVLDLQHVPADGREAEAERLILEELKRPFDLAQLPLIRWVLLRLAPRAHILLHVEHHLVHDGWSFNLFLSELCQLYRAFSEGRPSPLPELALQFADFAVWQRRWMEGAEAAGQLDFWRRQLANCPKLLRLPTERPRPPVQTFRGATYRAELPVGLCRGLRQTARQQHATLFMLMYAAFLTLLHRFTGETDLCVGSGIANRRWKETEHLMGMLVNNLVLRNDLSGDPSFSALLAEVRGVTLRAYANQDVPFDRVVEAVGPRRDLSHNPLFQVMFSFHDSPLADLSLPGMNITLMEGISNKSAKWDLSVIIIPRSEQRAGRKPTDADDETATILWEYNTDLFDAAFIERLSRQYQTLLEGVIAEPDRPISALPLLTEEERLLLARWNDTAREYPRDSCVHQLFEEQAEHSPQATALLGLRGPVTYREVNERANQLAHLLIERGVGPETLVAVLLERSPELIVALLAILKAGGAYLPLDAAYPEERLAFVLDDARPRLVLSESSVGESLARHRAEVVFLDVAGEEVGRRPRHNPESGAVAENLAYVMYTSGSTGTPKGTCVTHRGVVRLVKGAHYVELSERETMALFAPVAFDASTFEVWGCLLNGGRLLIPSPARLSLHEMVEAVEQYRLSTLWLTTGLFNQLVEHHAEELGRVRQVLTGGDVISVAHAEKFLRHADGATLFNCYGPTENTTFTTSYPMRGPQQFASSIPIGCPITNTQVFILDERLQHVPVGALGELYIGGDGLARCYLNRPGLTAERFVPNPFGERPGERLYRTGDFARHLADGNIEFLGRKDGQVKLRGFRVELNEIEAALEQSPDVAACAVVVREEVPGDKRLVAYCVPAAGALSVDALRIFIREKLPEYMVPSAFVRVEALPLTANGKVDRAALNAAGSARPETSSEVALPHTAAEGLISAAWREVLHLEHVGVRDNFFDLGGNSLLMLRLHRKLEETFGKRFPLLELFKHPTVFALAEFLNGAAPSRTPPAPAAREAAPLHDDRTTGPAAVAIVGLAGRFPGARDLAEFWENLRGGVESVSFFSHEELAAAGVAPTLLADPHYVAAGAVLEGADEFDAQFFGMTPREAEITDPQQRLFLECAWQAVESAGYDAERYEGRVGIFAGSGLNSYMLRMAASPEASRPVGDLMMALGNDKDYLPTRVSYKLNLRGPSVNVQTACSTSLVAVHLACRSLLADECDMALAGGVSLKIPQKAGYLYKPGGIHSPDGHCRAFDAMARGAVPGSGAGVVVLKRLDEALADGDTIHAVILGSAINNDGSTKVGYTAPSADGQAAVIAAAQRAAGVDAETISYVETHGTGTPLGDPIEVAALTKAFRQQTGRKSFCAIGSLKTNIGHLGPASGVTGLIKAVLALKHRELPPSLHYREPNPKIDFADGPFYVNEQLRAWEAGETPRRAGISSFGIGGTNAHVIVEEAPALTSSQSQRPYQLLLLSAKTETALEAATENLSRHLSKDAGQNFADVAYTYQVGRRTFKHRRMLVCSDHEDALRALQSRESRRILDGVQEEDDRAVAFMFPGVGDQYVGMAYELYRDEATFRQSVDLCCKILQPHGALSLCELLYPEGDPIRRVTPDEFNESFDLRRMLRRDPLADDASRMLSRTSIVHPALFVIEYALAQLWMSWGVRPQALIGHSIGEYVAACLAGVFSLEDALSLVVLRAQMIERQPFGAMVAVPLSEAEVQTFLSEQVSLAAVNSPQNCVLSGSADAVAALEHELGERGVACRRLQATHAFHSWMMEPVVEPLTEQLKKVELRPPQIPFTSNATGTWITDAQATDPAYWARHTCLPVRFADCLGEVLQRSDFALLEVGPGQALGAWALQHPAGAEVDGLTVAPSLRHAYERKSDWAVLLSTLGKLWLRGVRIDWARFHGHERRGRVPLPTYPFERRRFWFEGSEPAPVVGARDDTADVRRETAAHCFLPSWERLAPPLVEPPAPAAQPHEWLLFVDECGVGSNLAAELGRTQQQVVTVRTGGAFSRQGETSFTINPQSREDYFALLDCLADERRHPSKIIHLWNLSRADADAASVDAFESAQVTGLYSLLYVAEALARQEARATAAAAPLLYVVSNGMHDLTGNEELRPEKATSLAVFEALRRGGGGVGCTCIDIVLPTADTWQGRQLIKRLLFEFNAHPPGRLVALRGRNSWLRTYAQLRTDVDDDDSNLLRQRGVYLLTGGPPGDVFAFAKFLAETHQARLAFVSREDDLRLSLGQMQELEAVGSDILHVSAERADASQMRAAVARVIEQFGELHGVIHVAAPPPSSANGLARTSDSEVCRHFLAEAHSLYALEEALRDSPPDFCLLTMPSAPARGEELSPTHAAYGCFADAFACRHNQQALTPWMSLSCREVSPSAVAQMVQLLPSVNDAARVVFTADASGADGALASGPPEGDDAPPVARRNLRHNYVAPAGATERSLARLWHDLLGIENPGVHDSFFEIGGDSLLALQLLSRVRHAFNVEVPVRTLFEHPTVAELAAVIESLGGERQQKESPPVRRIARGNHLPLSFAQQRLWFVEQLLPASVFYNVGMSYRLRGPLDLAALERSLNEIISRHEALRTTFSIFDGQPVQVIHSPPVLTLPVTSLAHLNEQEQEQEVRRRARENWEETFDLEHPPFIRPRLLRLGERHHVLLVVLHHIVSDGWSMGVLLRELGALYEAYSQGQESPLAELEVQYADYTVWQREWLQGQSLEELLDYWKRALAGAPGALHLPTDWPKPAVQTHRGASIAVELSEELSRELKALCRAADTTLFITLFAAFNVLLHRYSGQEDILVGTPIANRNRVELENLIGFFANMLVLRTNLGGNPRFTELLARVKETALGAYAHQDLPFERLVEELQPERDLSRTPLFQVAFNLQNAPRRTLELSDLTITPMRIDTENTNYDLILEVYDDDDRVRGWLAYNTDLFADHTIRRMLRRFYKLLECIVARPTDRLSELDMLLEEEKELLNRRAETGDFEASFSL